MGIARGVDGSTIARYAGEFVGVRLSTGDSIGPALRAPVTRERQIVCATMRKEEGKDRREEEREKKEKERKSESERASETKRKSGGGRDGEKTTVVP